MGEEIERKWIISDVSEVGLGDAESEIDILQGYKTIDTEYEERCRRKDHRDGGTEFEYTEKRGTGLKREEKERAMEEEEFEEARDEFTGVVEKTRYKIPYGDKTLEVDVYKGELEGLVTAEVEFESEEEAEDFEKPENFGPDVTEDPGLKNKYLAFCLPKRAEEYVARNQ